MTPSIMWYVPLSFELLGPTTPTVFKFGSTTSRFKTRLTPLQLAYLLRWLPALIESYDLLPVS